jgi:hypothetical protein
MRAKTVWMIGLRSQAQRFASAPLTQIFCFVRKNAAIGKSRLGSGTQAVKISGGSWHFMNGQQVLIYISVP